MSETKETFKQNVADAFASEQNNNVDVLYANEFGHCFTTEFETSIKVKRADFTKAEAVAEESEPKKGKK